MYDLVFYNSKPLSVERGKLLTEKFPFAKFIEFDITLTNTAELAKKNVFTNFFWFIDSSYEFLDDMLVLNLKNGIVNTSMFLNSINNIPKNVNAILLQKIGK